MKFEIEKKYVVLSLVLALLVASGAYIEEMNNSFLNIFEMGWETIEKITYTFINVFVYLNVFFLVINSFANSSRLFVSLLLIISFSIYMYLTINASLYTFTQVVVGALIHTGIISVAIFGLYWLSKSKNKLFLPGAVVIFLVAAGMAYQNGSNQRAYKETNEDTKRIYINAGQSIATAQTYNMLLKVSQKEDVDKFEYFRNAQKELLKIRMDTITKIPFFLDILIENGYCRQWRLLKSNNAFKDFDQDSNKTANLIDDELIMKCMQ